MLALPDQQIGSKLFFSFGKASLHSLIAIAAQPAGAANRIFNENASAWASVRQDFNSFMRPMGGIFVQKKNQSSNYR
jgi:hypothetical protein